MSNSMTFAGIDGTEYDLSLNFLIVRDVSRADFSNVEKSAPNIMNLEGKVADLYNDMPMIAALAFAITWYKKCNSLPDFDQSKDNYQKEESRFLSNIDGNVYLKLRDALWNALADFFPALASDLSRIQIVNQAGLEEIEKQNQRLTEQGKTSVRKTITLIVNNAIASLESGKLSGNN